MGGVGQKRKKKNRATFAVFNLAVWGPGTADGALTSGHLQVGPGLQAGSPTACTSLGPFMLMLHQRTFICPPCRLG